MKMSAKFVIPIGLVGLLCLMLPGSLRADNFTFSFTNTIGNVSGTVSVEIMGLTNNATGPASQVILLGYPASLDPQVAAAGTNVTNWGFQIANLFTETSGVLVGEDFVASNIAGGTVEALLLDNITPPPVSSPLNPSPIDFLGYGPLFAPANPLPFVKAVETVPPIAGATTPEPTSKLLFVTGLLGLVLVVRRK
jgi:hypothetical protein